ncbi:MAG: DUF1273 domain-containing protein [Oscillospiraceae bacterium]|nr:DUF1273 domain-containing protein [Oscillospiraceae bacterium]
MICTIISAGRESAIKCRDEDGEPHIGIKKKLHDIVIQAYCEGYDEFFVNCEYGIPLWTAEIICEMKRYVGIKLRVVAPHEEHCRGWSGERQDRYYAVQVQADSFEYACIDYEERCYETAEEIMLDKSDRLIVFGKRSDKPYSAEYAKKRRIPTRFIGYAEPLRPV